MVARILIKAKNGKIDVKPARATVDKIKKKKMDSFVHRIILSTFLTKALELLQHQSVYLPDTALRLTASPRTTRYFDLQRTHV
jgi:rRNA processing protein Krr1/Pno1